MYIYIKQSKAKGKAEKACHHPIKKVSCIQPKISEWSSPGSGVPHRPLGGGLLRLRFCTRFRAALLVSFPAPLLLLALVFPVLLVLLVRGVNALFLGVEVIPLRGLVLTCSQGPRPRVRYANIHHTAYTIQLRFIYFFGVSPRFSLHFAFTLCLLPTATACCYGNTTTDLTKNTSALAEGVLRSTETYWKYH